MWLVSKKRRRLVRVCGGQLGVRAVDRRVQMERLEGLGQDIPSHDKVETLFITVVFPERRRLGRVQQEDSDMVAGVLKQNSGAWSPDAQNCEPDGEREGTGRYRDCPSADQLLIQMCSRAAR